MSIQAKNTRNKVAVHIYRPGTFSWQLICLVKTVGKEAIEKAYTQKKVNFCRFKEYVMNVLKVVDFNDWYLINKGTSVFTDTLSAYINHIEDRNSYYIAPDPITVALDRLIDAVAYNNNTIRKALQAA